MNDTERAAIISAVSEAVGNRTHSDDIILWFKVSAVLASALIVVFSFMAMEVRSSTIKNSEVSISHDKRITVIEHDVNRLLRKTEFKR